MNKNEPVKFNITDAEKSTAICLLQDMTVKQITQLRHLSFHGVQSQTKRIREKMSSIRENRLKSQICHQDFLAMGNQ